MTVQAVLVTSNTQGTLSRTALSIADVFVDGASDSRSQSASWVGVGDNGSKQ